jgi:hypothetical protein
MSTKRALHPRRELEVRSARDEIAVRKLADAARPLSIALVKLSDSSSRRSMATDNVTDASEPNPIAFGSTGLRGGENAASVRKPGTTVEAGMPIARFLPVNERLKRNVIRFSLLLSLPATSMIAGCWHERRDPDVYYVEHRRSDPEEHREHERREERRDEHRDHHEHDDRW